jgi:SAM-dependent methyltransferase
MNPTGRFSNRAEHYVKYRPGYPDTAFDVLAEALPMGCEVADVGSGTGISSRWLRKRAGLVYSVEPNREMRESAEAMDGIVTVNGTAEATTLPDGCVDTVVCATAFHWFDVEASRREFARILRPGGHVALLWNVRQMPEYERIVDAFAVEPLRKWDEQTGDIAGEFFGSRMRTARVPNDQWLDWEGLLGRAMSASYMPLPGDPRFVEMEAALREYFARESREGLFKFAYETAMYWGQVQ